MRCPPLVPALLVAGALAAQAASPRPPSRLKPGQVCLTIYSPHSEDRDDFQDDLARVARHESPGGREPSSGDLLATQARHLGLAVVRECRSVALPAGVGECRFSDVAAMLDATTTRLLDQTDPDGTTVLEQNFLYDLVDSEALLKRFIDRPVELTDAKGSRHRGTLLSADFPLIIRGRDGSARAIQPGERKYWDESEFFRPERPYFSIYKLRFPELPANFVTRPTLAWKLKARQAGDHDVVVSYQTGGLAWRCDYTATLNDDGTKLDLSGWVTLANVCGTRFPDARVKLVAGDVHRANPPRLPSRWEMAQEFFGGDEEDAEPQFTEKPLFEYHLYTLQRTTTVENNQTKQIELLRVPAVPVKRVYTYDGAHLPDDWWDYGSHRDESYGAECRTSVRAHVEFENRREAGLGIPLPGGIVRLYQRDPADGSPEFVGGEAIRHTPRDERLRLYFGSAFDVVGHRVRKTYEEPKVDQVRESFEIELRNHKPTPITVYVLEHLYRATNWKVEKSSLPHKPLDDRSIEFALPVPANGRATVTYTVLYWWPPEPVGYREF
ncbi:MAG: hypothetical protein FJ290_03845 [Planctomycetes bacterium]|nr:hypothetical protein [Planctomycetota bacterium]